MSELATLARPYAEAVFKRAKETGGSEQWSETLAFLTLVMEDEDLRNAARNPRIDRSRFCELMLDICKGNLSEEGENFVKLLVLNNRLSLIGQIKELFEGYRAEDEGYVDVNVTTALPFPEEEKDGFTSTLEKLLNKKVRLQVGEDPDLIGGVLVRAGDRVIDGSVRGQLQQLAKRLYS